MHHVPAVQRKGLRHPVFRKTQRSMIDDIELRIAFCILIFFSAFSLAKNKAQVVFMEDNPPPTSRFILANNIIQKKKSSTTTSIN